MGFSIYCHEQHFVVAATVFPRDCNGVCRRKKITLKTAKNGNGDCLYLFVAAFFSVPDRFLKPFWP